MESVISYVYISFNEPLYLNIVHNIILDEIANGHEVHVIDSSEVVAHQDYVNKFIVRSLRVRTNKHEFDIWLKALGVTHLHITKNSKFSLRGHSNKTWQEITNSADFDRHLESSLISYFSDTKPARNSGYDKKKSSLIFECLQIFHALENSYRTTKHRIRVFIPNGRFIDQWFVREFFSGLSEGKCDVLYFEKGFLSGSYYLGETSLLDRVQLQRKYEQLVDVPEFCFRLAEDWFNKRRDMNYGHEFTKLWSFNEKIESTSSESPCPMVTIFTSSEDEFARLGSEWELSEWGNQWDAFEAVINRYSVLGYRVVMRVHPNFLNKSQPERVEIAEKLKVLQGSYPNLIVYGASETINSYELVKISGTVFVWGSTIGLESVNLGIPTVILNASEWDLSVDVVRVLNIGELRSLKDPLPFPNMYSAQQYLAKRISLDKPISDFQKELFAEPKGFRYRLATSVGHRGKISIRILTKAIFGHRIKPSLKIIFQRISLRRREIL